jgi:type II secretory pathway component GspD/PulD (secretin)
MFEVLPDKWPEVARQFGLKANQRLRAAPYTRQLAAALLALQKQNAIHLMSEPVIATVSGYPASLSIGGGEDQAADDLPSEDDAVHAAHESEDEADAAAAGYTLELLPRASGGGRVRLEMTYSEGAPREPNPLGDLPARSASGAQTVLDLRHGQTIALVLATAGGGRRAPADASPKILLITPEVLKPGAPLPGEGDPAPTARRPSRAR